jgi:hypothetical protein
MEKMKRPGTEEIRASLLLFIGRRRERELYWNGGVAPKASPDLFLLAV